MFVRVFLKNNGLVSTAVAATIRDAIEVSFTHARLWGPLSGRVRMHGDLDDAFTIADQWLGNGVEIRDDDGDLLWTGLIWSVKFGTGTRGRTRSLDGYANYVQVVYAGNLPTSPASDDDAIFRYGRIHLVETNTQLTVDQAEARRNRLLAERSQLLYAPESGGRSDIELGLTGWFRTLRHRPYVSATAGSAAVETVVQNVLTACGQYLASDFSQIQTTGATAPQTYDRYEAGADIIKRCLGLIPTPWTFGVGLDRVPYLRPSNRLATTATYIERANGIITDATGGEIDPWDVRPDAVLKQADFVPATVASSLALDDVANVYLEETTYSTRSGLSYKPAVAGVNGAIDA